MRYEWAAPAAYPRPESPGSGAVFVPSAPYIIHCRRFNRVLSDSVRIAPRPEYDRVFIAEFIFSGFIVTKLVFLRINNQKSLTNHSKLNNFTEVILWQT